MTDRLTDALTEALRPIVAELVAEELERFHNPVVKADDEPPPYLTVVQYAERHHATPAAVRARIRRGSLQAIRPPGGREYLIPNDRQPGGHRWLPWTAQPNAPRDASTSEGPTPKE